MASPAAAKRALAPTPDTKRVERMFYTGMAVACAAVIFAGFSRTYYLRGYFGGPALTPLLQVHGLVFTCWLVLLVVQTALVAANRTRIHRKLGVAGGVLAGLMVVLGTATAIIRAKVTAAPPGIPPLAFLTIPLGDMVVFPALCGAGLYFRRRPDIHKRLMLLATLAILPAGIARLPLDVVQKLGPLAFFGLTDVLILVCVAYDLYSAGRVHRATVWGGLLIFISQPLRIMIGNTGPWMAFAEWLTQGVS